MSAELTVVLQNIQHSAHLREDQHPRSLRLHRLEQLVQDHHLAGIIDEVFVGSEGWSRFGAVEDCRLALLTPIYHYIAIDR